MLTHTTPAIAALDITKNATPGGMMMCPSIMSSILNGGTTAAAVPALAEIPAVHRNVGAATTTRVVGAKRMTEAFPAPTSRFTPETCVRDTMGAPVPICDPALVTTPYSIWPAAQVVPT